ncbi:unnamed protein product [Eruca vesicaria subsp. sativa]|uniref:FRIGIDA-like protein n=1 Tax=Eruca vesicaria subsp. sativa TaxID=29727 RepID=A0ABC8LUD7_ERUVS|nr:unnamed protein product [Eruca vesicaria subsp. sativa]
MEESKVEKELQLCRVRGEGLRKALDEVYAYASNIVEARIRELDSKEVELRDRAFAIEERAKKVEEGEAQLVDLEMKVETKRKELNSIKNQVEICVSESNAEEMRLSELRRSVEECEAEKVLKVSELGEMMVEIDCKGEQLGHMETDLERCHAEISAEMESLRKLDEEAERKLKDLKMVQDKVEECEKMFETRSSELVSKEKELKVVSEKIDLREKTVMSLNNDMKEACQRMETKGKELEDVRRVIEERSAHCESLKLLIQERSEEAVSKVKQHDEIIVAIRNSNEELDSVKKKIQDSLKDFQSKEEEQARREQGLKLKEKELCAREEMINKKDQQLKSTEQKLGKSSKKTELKAKRQGNRVQQVDLVRDANVCDEKTMQLLLRGHLKKYDQLHLDVLSSVKRSYDPAKLVLDTINGLYAAHQRTSAKNLDTKSVQRSSIFLLECLMDMSTKPTAEVQGEAIKFATEWKNTNLVEAENPVEVLEFLHFLAAFSLVYTFDADKVQSIFDVAFLRKYSPSLCKALGLSSLAPVNSVPSLNEQQPIINSNDLYSSDVQQSIASSHLPNEDSLRDFEGSTSFSQNENPGRFVLTSVEDALKDAHQRGVLSLEEPALMTLVPLLEEMELVVISTDPDLDSEATRMAHQWVGMMGASEKKSELEVWAFLQFMVAFGLVIQTRQDETLQLASRVAHFRQAPKLFQSLGLSDAIPNFVTQLLDKGLYIPAIRFMFYFKVENNFSPLEFLKEQIINLRRSAQENRRYGSQAEANRDAVTLRDIMELIEDFKAHAFPLMAQIRTFQVPTSFGEAPNQPVNVESYQAGDSTAFQGQSSHQAGFKRPRVDPEGSRPCSNPPPSFG